MKVKITFKTPDALSDLELLCHAEAKQDWDKLDPEIRQQAIDDGDTDGSEPDTGDIPVSFNDLVWLKQFGKNVLVEATSDFMRGEYSDWPSSLLVIRIIK